MVDLSLDRSVFLIDVPHDARVSAIDDRYASAGDILAARFKLQCVFRLEVT